MFCQRCSEEKLTRMSKFVKACHKNKTYLVELYYSVCQYCGTQQIDRVEANLNLQEIINFTLKIDNSLTQYVTIH